MLELYEKELEKQMIKPWHRIMP